MTYKRPSFISLAEIKDYDDMVGWFSKARNPTIGRPLKSWARVFKVVDAYEIRFGNTTFAVLTPDNKLTFPLTPSSMRMMSNTLSQASYRALPFIFQRIATGRYAIEHSKALDKRIPTTHWWRDIRESAPEYFQGIQFDMETGECVNKRPRITDSINKQARKQWLSKVRKFKQGVKVRAKLGVLQTICQQVVAERASDRSQWSQPDWTSAFWTDSLYEAIRDEQIPTEILKGFVMSSRVSYWRNENPTPQSALEAMDSVFSTLSVELRRRFGVFNFGDEDESQ